MQIRNFRIEKLYGYKDVQIDFHERANIVVAENGSGKTTILNALNAILTGRLKRLTSLDFENIIINFEDGLEIALSKFMLNDSSGAGEDLVDRLSSESGVPSEDILSFVKESYVGRGADFRSSRVFSKILIRSPYSSDVIHDKLDAIKDALNSDESITGLIKSNIRSQLSGMEVVFLPTYRRVELPLTRPVRRAIERHPHTRAGSHSGVADSRFRGMNFGLSDVEERLSELADEVERRSSAEYRLVSARMVNQLLQWKITDAEAEKYPLPDIDALEMFFSRVERGGKIANAAALRRFYEGSESASEQQTFLRYFLGQLSQVIDQTRAIEEMLRVFVDACNQYLQMSSDEKSLTYVPESMKVEVRNSWTGDEVEMEALSSGEKQIISLLAKLYLEPARKVMLIDEPELSLSLDWQKRVLMDVYQSESVSQFLAITHSPFVFDNDLARFASPLQTQKIRISKE